ncbi:MAG: enoyl-CoA hydratase/isomerase family protein [Chloroflexi bacterium]|nr:enoyl-CoA hydratase/isomerase family protein [Chloroflexota bacterium]
MAGSYEHLILEKTDGIARLTLNRPEALNALSMEMRAEMPLALAEIRSDPSVRAVILTGAGRAFCAGGDVKNLTEEQPSASRMHSRMRELHRWLLDLVNLDRPVIAMVNGHAAGAGANLALACDLAIAADHAKFTQAFVKIGLVPDAGGMYFLPRAVGLAKAKELMYLGRTIDAREALEIGMISQVVPAEELEATTMDLAKRLAGGATRAISLMKSVLNRSSTLSLEDLLELEAHAQGMACDTADFREGVTSFVEKRSPTFRGA